MNNYCKENDPSCSVPGSEQQRAGAREVEPPQTSLNTVSLVSVQPRYICCPLYQELDFGVIGMNYDLADLLLRAEEPA